jgi:hypothetical protein
MRRSFAGTPPRSPIGPGEPPDVQSLKLRRRTLITGAAALVAAPAIIGLRADAADPSGDLTVAVPDYLTSLDPADDNDTSAGLRPRSGAPTTPGRFAACSSCSSNLPRSA